MINKLTQILIAEIEMLENNTQYSKLSDYDKGYLDGEHDHCICLLNELGIQHNYTFRGTGYSD